MASIKKMPKKILVLSVLCFPLLLFMALPAFTVEYEYTELQPPGWGWLIATDINDDGVVVGYGIIGTPALYGPLIRRGFIYSNGEYTELLPPGWDIAGATGINNRGEVVGDGFLIDEDNTTDNYNYRGFIYKDGIYTELSPPWPDLYVDSILGITDNGEVVGTLTKRSDEYLYNHAFIYWQGEYRRFMRETLCFINPFLYLKNYKGINNNCAVVGNAVLLTIPYIIEIDCGFVYRGGRYTWLRPGSSHFSATTVAGINDDGVVVGSAMEKGFIYRYGIYTWLMPPGYEQSAALAINNNGAVVVSGTDDAGNDKLFVYSNGTYTELLLPPCCEYPQYSAINNNRAVALTLGDIQCVTKAKTIQINNKGAVALTLGGDNPLWDFYSRTHVFIAVPKSN